MMYDCPEFPGFAKFHDSALGEWVWPHGTGWCFTIMCCFLVEIEVPVFPRLLIDFHIIVWNRANEAHVGPELKGKADAAIAAEREKAKAVLKKAGGIKGWLASL
jgi:hypothetical protein|eukprot:COSAG02_NODE_170_length_31534_cov_33.568498_4_plen_104_part_00